ncbi:MAG: hypothetical protein ACRETD_02530, partial [Steroidobacteraceae bacterium]
WSCGQSKADGPRRTGGCIIRIWRDEAHTNKLFTENVQFYTRLGYGIDREEELKGGFVVHMSKPVRSLAEGD